MGERIIQTWSAFVKDQLQRRPPTGPDHADGGPKPAARLRLPQETLPLVPRRKKEFVALIGIPATDL